MAVGEQFADAILPRQSLWSNPHLLIANLSQVTICAESHCPSGITPTWLPSGNRDGDNRKSINSILNVVLDKIWSRRTNCGTTRSIPRMLASTRLPQRPERLGLPRLFTEAREARLTKVVHQGSGNSAYQGCHQGPKSSAYQGMPIKPKAAKFFWESGQKRTKKLFAQEGQKVVKIEDPE